MNSYCPKCGCKIESTGMTCIYCGYYLCRDDTTTPVQTYPPKITYYYGKYTTNTIPLNNTKNIIEEEK